MKPTKFEDHKFYRNKCLIAGPLIIPEHNEMSGKDWLEILVFEVPEHSFHTMFEEIPTPDCKLQSLPINDIS